MGFKDIVFGKQNMQQIGRQPVMQQGQMIGQPVQQQAQVQQPVQIQTQQVQTQTQPVQEGGYKN